MLKSYENEACCAKEVLEQTLGLFCGIGKTDRVLMRRMENKKRKRVFSHYRNKEIV